jgi:ubiquinone/menaquinone biosynthesis C-methylase UbiE
MATSGGIEPRAFWAFELAGWEHAAEPYQRHWGSLTRQAIPSLLEAIRADSGVGLLDVACGPGWVSAAADERGARPLGIDFSPNMVQRARQFAPGLGFVVGDAEELPLSASRVDAVAINFGLLHLGRPERAIEEAFRVLRPGGRVGFTVWAPPEEAVVFGVVLRAVSTYGDPKVPLPAGPPFFRFSDPEEARSLLAKTGFVDPAVERIDQVWRVPSAADVFEAMHQGTARTGGLLRRQTPLQLESIRAAVLAELNPYTVGDMVELPMPAVLASATKP